VILSKYHCSGNNLEKYCESMTSEDRSKGQQKFSMEDTPNSGFEDRFIIS